MSLKKQALNGIKWTSFSSITIALIQLAQLIILAHYLDPSDFGLMAIVTVIIGFSTLFIDLGISASIIHKQDITHIQLSTLYWINVGSGMFLFGIIYSLAPTLAAFYNQNELQNIIRLLSLTFIISGVGNQFGILLQKKLKFNILAKVSVASTLLSFAVAIFLAVNGHGVYALVYASLTTTIVTTFLTVIAGIKEHKPSLIFNHHQVLPMLSFGAFQMGERGLNYVNSQFDIILIGKLLGAESLGIYSVAKSLAMSPANIINPIITKVTFPVMATVQDNLLLLKEVYLKSLNYLSSINFPIYILLAILAEPLIGLFFGDNWKGSIIILQILSIYAAVRSTGNPIGSLLLARGRANLGFYWNFGLFFFIPITIYIGSFWGLVGVTYSLLAVVALLLIPNWYFLVEPICGARLKEYFLQIFKPLFISLSSGIVTYTITSTINIENTYFNLILTCSLMLTLVLILNIRFNPQFIRIVMDLISRENVKQS